MRRRQLIFYYHESRRWINYFFFGQIKSRDFILQTKKCSKKKNGLLILQFLIYFFEALAETSRSRNSYFITTKVEGGLTAKQTIAEHDKNLRDLGLSYVDLLLIHFPATWSGVGSKQTRQEQVMF